MMSGTMDKLGLSEESIIRVHAGIIIVLLLAMCGGIWTVAETLVSFTERQTAESITAETHTKQLGVIEGKLDAITTAQIKSDLQVQHNSRIIDRVCDKEHMEHDCSKLY